MDELLASDVHLASTSSTLQCMMWLEALHDETLLGKNDAL
jgi:hypothetical protein